VDTLKGHKKKVTSVKFHPTEKMAFTTSADGTSMVWGHNAKTGRYSMQHHFTNHTAEVAGCTVHPSGSYMITASMDKTWCLYDVVAGACRMQVTDDKITAGYTQVTLHPDGVILGTGTADSIVRIFDVKQQKNVANFKGHSGIITSMAFSENGYYLASGDDKGVVKLWDLRNLKNCNFHTIDATSASTVNSLQFDASGSYLAKAGSGLEVYTSKQWEVVQTWDDHSKDVTAVQWGHNAEWFATVSKDRTLKIFGEK